MRSSPLLVAAACLVTASACLAGKKSEVFSVDPQKRGFSLPEHPIVLFFVDGLRADVLEAAAQQGKLPRLQRTLFDRGAHVRSAVTSVPTVTYANAVTMLTGCWPSTHGVWANATFDRAQLLTRNYEDKREYAADDDTRDSLFEMLPDRLTAGIALPFERGVKISRGKSATSGGAAFGVAFWMGREEDADQLLSEQLVEVGEEVRRFGEWPALLVIHLPGVDDVGHENGSDSAQYRDAVANLDHAIGDVLEAFEHGAMLDKLTIVLTADHGHHPTPYALELQDYVGQALGAPTVVSLENDGDVPYLQRRERYTGVRAVVVPNGVREASIHLRAGEDWRERPTLEQIVSFPALFGAGSTKSVPAALLVSPAIDLVVVRAGEGAVRVYGRRGSAAIRSTRVGSQEPYLAYEVLEGVDPLGYGANEHLREWMRSAHTSREWLAATADLRYPDLVPQLVTAFADERSGDLVLFAAAGWDFSAEHYIGGHGGVEPEEMHIPMWFAGPGIRAGAEVPAARLVDLVPTLLDLAGAAPPASPPLDGVSFAAQLR